MPRARAMLATLLVLPSAAALGMSPDPADASSGPEPLAVLALIDTGINPYHVAFRDAGPLAQQHPCTYIPGYPCSAEALRISLDAPSFEAARAADQDLWGALGVGQLYWIPGTKIVGAIRFGSGGVSCPLVAVPPATMVNRPGGPVGGALGYPPCPDELPILDDHGHGTMTASRAAGNAHALCPSCRLVVVEGLGLAGLAIGARGVRWAADQGWIDVQSNSWINLLPAPVENLGDDPANPQSTGLSFAYAAKRMVTLAASGNGAAHMAGVAPMPTQTLSTAAPGVVVVGGHDNGRVTAWSGAPPTLVADAYGGWAAARDSLTRWQPDPAACCTSAAAPYAAGGAAALVLEARRILGDASGPGIRDGVVARGSGGAPARGPLADGLLTLDELLRVHRHTAQARPGEGPDDGLLHALAAVPAGQPPPVALLAAHGPGANPACQGCWTLPVSWSAVPAELQQYPLIGYGAIDATSLAQGAAVLRGLAPEPDRAGEDELYALDQQLRAAVFFPDA